MCVVGKSGDGKSALLAHFGSDLAETDTTQFVLSHFIGASLDSVDVSYVGTVVS